MAAETAYAITSSLDTDIAFRYRYVPFQNREKMVKMTA